MDIGNSPRILFMWNKYNNAEDHDLTNIIQKACISNIVVISETLAVEDKRSEKYSASLRARDYKYSAEPALKMLVCNKLFQSTSSAFAHESLVELLFIIHGDTNFRILLGMPKVKCFDDMLPNNNNNHDIPSLASNINHTTEFPLLINKLLNTARNIFSAAMLKKYNLAPQHADFVKFEHPTETLSCIYLISLSIDVYLARTSKKNQLSVRELISNCCNFFEKFLSDTNFFLSLSSALSLMRMIQINKTAMHNQIKLDDKNKFTLEYATAHKVEVSCFL